MNSRPEMQPNVIVWRRLLQTSYIGPLGSSEGFGGLMKREGVAERERERGMHRIKLNVQRVFKIVFD